MAGGADRAGRAGRLPRRLGTSSGKRAGRPEADWRRLVAAARAADPDPWRDALRARVGTNDAQAARRVPPPGRRCQGPRRPARAEPDLAGPSAQVQARRPRAGRAGAAAGRLPPPGRLLGPCRAGQAPRRRLRDDVARSIPPPGGGGAAPDGRGGDPPRQPHGPRQPRPRPGGPGEARRGGRRIPRGDPAQARPASAHSNLGLALAAQGKIDEAIAAYREAIRLKPDAATAPTSISASPC